MFVGMVVVGLGMLVVPLVVVVISVHAIGVARAVERVYRRRSKPPTTVRVGIRFVHRSSVAALARQRKPTKAHQSDSQSDRTM